jgi:hypothetical protein
LRFALASRLIWLALPIGAAIVPGAIMLPFGRIARQVPVHCPAE